MLPAELEARRQQIDFRREHILWNKLLPVVRQSLASREFQFTGTLATGEKRVSISPELAAAARIDIENDTISLPGGGPSWFGVTVEYAAEQQPESGSITLEAPPVTTIRAQTAWKTWLADGMKNAPLAPRPKANVKQDGLTQGLPAISERAFERAWVAAIQDSGASAWAAAGRRRKTPTGTSN